MKKLKPRDGKTRSVPEWVRFQCGDCKDDRCDDSCEIYALLREFMDNYKGEPLVID